MSAWAVLWTTEQAARRLGVKPATVYAYVSRGVLHSTRDPSGRGSLFRADEVERLAQRRAPKRAAKNPGPLIGTALTQAVHGHLLYRGRDVATLARTETFESVAALLWTGKTLAPLPFSCPAAPLTAARAALATLPPTTPLLHLLRVTTAVLAATTDAATTDAATTDAAIDAKAVAAVGRTLLAALVDALPAAAIPPTAPTAPPAPLLPGAGDLAPQSGDGLARRLWGKLTWAPAEPGLVRALDAALILLADHDLAASTFAARVAASTHASPYAVVLAGLSAFEGPLHGAAAGNAYRLMQEAIESGDAVGVFSQRLRVDGHVDGFADEPGSVYPEGDPRAATLLSIVDALPVPAKVKEAINDLRRAASYRSTRLPSVEFALAALMHACAMRSDAGEAIFVIARVAGWLAHAIEEYEAPELRYRYQGTYVGSRYQPAGTAA